MAVLPELPDLILLAARVSKTEAAMVAALVDLDALATVIEETRRESAHGEFAAAATLLVGTLRHRPFHRSNRRIAVAATVHLLALNGRVLEVPPVDELERLLDEATRDPLSEPMVTVRLRSYARIPRSEDVPKEEERNMFEKFTDRARRAISLAQDEARWLRHNYIGTEHVLLGIIHEGGGVAATALQEMGVSLEAVRAQVEEIIGEGKDSPSGHIPFTPRAKKVLELGLRECVQLGHDHIGTEHILLGLIREGKGVAAQVLVKLGADLKPAREKVVEVLGRTGSDAPTERPSTDRLRLIAEVTGLFDENDRLREEVRRLRSLLIERGVDPDELPDAS